MSQSHTSLRYSVLLLTIVVISVTAIVTNRQAFPGFLTAGTVVSAQEAPLAPTALAYTRSSFTSAYSPISVAGGATQINGGTGTGDFSTSSGVADVGDGTAYIALPFSFSYNGAALTPGTNFVGICTNGFAYFSASNTNNTKEAAFGNTNLFTTTGPNNTLAPYYDNLIANTAVNGITGSVLHQTSGAAGSRVLTVQWGNYPSFFSGTARALNFQLKIYEGTNVIEFHYGPVVEGIVPGGVFINESASIGIENQAGGNNNYLDALSGSSQTNNSMMTSGKFPKYNFRFAPGAPTAVSSGTYNVGVGQFYPNLSEAVADINHRGIAGPVTLNLTDSNYDYSTPNGSNIFPLVLGPVAGSAPANTIKIERSSGTATLTASGSGDSGNIGNQISNSFIDSSNEPILALVGADHVSVRNLNFAVTPGSQTSLSGSNVDHALLVMNSATNDGATNNTFRDLSFTLDRANSDTIAILQFSSSVTAPSGANSTNKYYNLAISNSFAGIWLRGTAITPDTGCEVGVTGSFIRNTIGGANANDIGNGIQQTWGIRASGQSGVRLFNNEIRNITGTASSGVDGIILDNAGSGTVSVGTNEISGNIIHDLNNTVINAGAVSGIRASLTNNAGSVANIFNNSIYNLNSASTATATRRIIGIWSQDTLGGAAGRHNIHNNSVRIAPTNLLTSNTAFEIGSSTPTFNVRNNIFVNFTGTQSGAAGHYTWVSPSATSIGGPGTVSDFNDLYIDNEDNGFVGRGATTNFATLTNWQTILAGAGPDDNSISSNPLFTSPTDLHLTLLSPTIDRGTTVASILFDIDGDPRPRGLAFAYDIGSDETIPEMNVRGQGITISDGDSTPAVTDDTDFGQTPVNGGTVSHVFTIENTGIAALNLPGTPRVAIGGPNATDFSVTVQPGSPLSSGTETTTFVVLFDPSMGGLSSATVSIANDDTNEAPYDFAIQGTGTVPDMDVKGLGISIAAGDTTPAALDDTDFGGANPASGTVSHVFTIENIGLAALILSVNPRVVLGGANAADFSVSVQPNSPLPTAGTTTFTIVFDPAAAGLRTATISIASDDPDENPYNFAIQGTGVIPSANATITGRVTTPAGLALRNAIVALTDSQGVRRIATTSSFGVYSFADVATGQTYILGVSSRRYRFAPQSMTITGDLNEVNFVGLE